MSPHTSPKLVASEMPVSRDYQTELLRESVQRNIIITLPTGTGKTHIAILRIQHQLQHSKKLSWFLCPTVALCNQQHAVISSVVPKVMLVSGVMEPERWTSPAIWQAVASNNVVVSTPQVLLDALSHSYLKLRTDIGLLIFDEAHHAILDHPYNRIMQENYFKIQNVEERPAILGLTASPVYGNDVQKHLDRLESNLDAVVRLPRMHEEELAQFVHKPELRYASYALPWDIFNRPEDPYNLALLKSILESLDIEEDPWVISNRQRLAGIPASDPQRFALEQKLAKAIYKRDTSTHRSLKTLVRTADDLYLEMGTWVLDHYLQSALDYVLGRTSLFGSSIARMGGEEKGYFLSILQDFRGHIQPPPVLGLDDGSEASNERSTSFKMDKLIETLLREKRECDELGTRFVGLLLVTTRAAALMLKDVLSAHPTTSPIFQCGCLVGLSSYRQRSNAFDMSYDSVFVAEYQRTLDLFRLGEINLLVATSVAEEGLDIQACGSVIRFDIPPNLQSWIQSQGRARKQRSTFTVMVQESMHTGLTSQWEVLREKIEEMCKVEREKLMRLKMNQEGTDEDYGSDDDDDDNEAIEVESTGARIALGSAVGHLQYFCAKFPHSPYTRLSPTYTFSPSQVYLLFHPVGADQFQAPLGPFQATVTLPSLVPPHLRTFTTPLHYSSTRKAKRHVALQAYKALYEAGLLDDHLLPFRFPGTTDRETIQELMKEVEGRESLAVVPKQVNSWLNTQSLSLSSRWHSISISIESINCPPLRIYAQTNLLHHLDSVTVPILDVNGVYREANVTYVGSSFCGDEDDVFDQSLAERFTRALWWCKWGSRMNWDVLDFAYLILPAKDGVLTRKVAAYSKEDIYMPGGEFINSHKDGYEIIYPTLAKRGDGASVIVERISYDPPSESDLETSFYRRLLVEDPETLRPPFIFAGSLSRRTNYLADYPYESTSSGERKKESKSLLHLPSSMKICAINPPLIHMSFILPSIIEHLIHRTTARAAWDAILADAAVDSSTELSLIRVPFDLIFTALTSPAAQKNLNYERLETLGDMVLKVTTSICLLAEHEHWHEDYLVRAKDHIVSNGSLSRAAIKRKLAKYIIRQAFKGRKWVPPLRGVKDVDTNREDQMEASGEESQEEQDPLSTKMLADVVEALLGACYLGTADDESGGFQASVELLQLLLPQPGFTWAPPPLLAQKINARTKELTYYPAQLAEVESALGYTFCNKTHLLEALTHSSHQQMDLHRMTYERHEFLGDAILDIIITKWFHEATADPTSTLGQGGAPPGHLYHCKIATVNADLLGFLCFEIKYNSTTTIVEKKTTAENEYVFVTKEVETSTPFWKYLYHSSSLILDQQTRCALRCERFRSEILSALHEGTIYPWAGLRSLLLPKIFSDMVEAILGAMYIDACGDLNVCWQFLQRIGLSRMMERFAAPFSVSEKKMDNPGPWIDMRHPTTVWSGWAVVNEVTYGYLYETSSDGKLRCVLVADQEIVGDVSAFGKGKILQEALRVSCTEQAVAKFGCRGAGLKNVDH